MSIKIFSKCVFTRFAFPYLLKANDSKTSISIVDVEDGIDTILLNRIINDRKIDFVIILNNRNHTPLLIANNVIIVSKRLSTNSLKNLILTISALKEINGNEVLLSPSEKTLFYRWLQGISMKTIAKNMSITHKTANNMRNSIYRKYGIKDHFTFLLIAEISRIHHARHTEHRKIPST